MRLAPSFALLTCLCASVPARAEAPGPTAPGVDGARRMVGDMVERIRDSHHGGSFMQRSFGDLLPLRDRVDQLSVVVSPRIGTRGPVGSGDKPLFDVWLTGHGDTKSMIRSTSHELTAVGTLDADGAVVSRERNGFGFTIHHALDQVGLFAKSPMSKDQQDAAERRFDPMFSRERLLDLAGKAVKIASETHKAVAVRALYDPGTRALAQSSGRWQFPEYAGTAELIDPGALRRAGGVPEAVAKEQKDPLLMSFFEGSGEPILFEQDGGMRPFFEKTPMPDFLEQSKQLLSGEK